MHTLVSVLDGLAYAPSPVGTLVCITLDVSGRGGAIWYEKQERTPGENYVVWRRIDGPHARKGRPYDAENAVRDFMREESDGAEDGEPKFTHILESEFLKGDMLREAERRWGRVERIWVNEES